MINTKIYQSVYQLSEKLLKASQKQDQTLFDTLYAELKAICVDNENSHKDHPEQWETLADFTEDYAQALIGYEKAMRKAMAIDSKDHMASIAFSMATLQLELGQKESAIKQLQSAKISAANIEDKAFKLEIEDLLQSLLPE